MSKPILSVKNLSTHFFTDRGVARAVGNVSYEIKPGETLGVVGESGCGKSVTALSVLRLIPDPPGKIVGGEIEFEGVNLLDLPEKEMRKIRGNKISMIFQEPMTSLNPVFRVGHQISEALILHESMTKKDAQDRSIELLSHVGIPSPQNRIHDYPHQMSGGMRQRVMIAMALACSPKLLIADEPTTALDVTIQAQILELMDKLREETGTAIQLITHDLGVIAETAHKVVVMYAGRVVEQAEVGELFNNTLHPYTRGLMRSIPGLGAQDEKERLETIPGVVPSLLRLPQGCRFHDRCRHATERCSIEEPDLVDVGSNHLVRCWLHQK